MTVQMISAPWKVIPLVRVQFVRPASGSAWQVRDDGQGIDQGHEGDRIMVLDTGDRERQRNPLGINDHMPQLWSDEMFIHSRQTSHAISAVQSFVSGSKSPQPHRRHSADDPRNSRAGCVIFLRDKLLRSDNTVSR